MAASIGIYFGGTTACVAIHKDGKTEVVANDAGDRTTPTAVAFRDNEKIVGLAAKQGKMRNPVNTIFQVKHIIGRKFEDEVIQGLKRQSPFKVVESKGLAGFEIELNNKKNIVSSMEVAVHVLRKLKEIAVHQGGKDVKDTVLTCPVEFSDEQREAIRKAAESAGFNVLRLISDPSAAVLAYEIGVTKPHDPCNALVYRLGGSSVSVSLVNITNGLQRVVTSNTSRECAGNDFTQALAESCATDFKRQWRMDITDNKRAMGKLYNACETGKHVLSTINSASISVDSLYEGVDFHSNVSRAKFESIINVPLQRCLQVIQTTLQENGMSAADIHKVIVIGGSTRIPKLQNLLKDRFPESELLSSISPDEVVAIGAAVQAALLSSREGSLSCSPSDLQTPCTAKSIFIKVVDEAGSSLLHPIVPKHSYIPLRQQHYFTVPKDQDSLSLQLVEGEPTSFLDETTKLGKIILRDLVSEEPQEGKVTLDLHLKRDGTLEVTCSESVSGSMDSLVISPSIKNT
ncbi:heat shock 70 kDa protein 14-like isoform X2 [Lytechinus variegatus]|uniref:heat shock 70 kDa protein 14-like isoform X2 n=1 Tax=Lytechinus variegatus TaxID=7654 RepID=UPI001BB2B318|nr:heat shock 70 kDa protein 14-like isoform X2 [Lytechinus variegatus]